MKLKRQELLKYLLCALAAAMMITASSSASTITGLGVGEFPNSGQVFTVNPWAISPRANRGIANTRQEGQTFKNSSTFEVGEIDVSFDVTGGNVAGTNATGLKLQIFEVADVSAAWAPGTLIKELSFPGILPGSTEGLRFTLTGADKFILPARGGPGDPAGYGLVISTPNRLSTDGNPGVVYYTDSGTLFPDPYVDGRFYRDGTGGNLGSPDSLRRDMGVAMRAPEPTSIGLVLVGLIGLWAGRRDR